MSNGVPFGLLMHSNGDAETVVPTEGQGTAEVAVAARLLEMYPGESEFEGMAPEDDADRIIDSYGADVMVRECGPKVHILSLTPHLWMFVSADDGATETDPRGCEVCNAQVLGEGQGETALEAWNDLLDEDPEVGNAGWQNVAAYPLFPHGRVGMPDPD